MKNYEGRYLDLKKKLNSHLKKLTGIDMDFFSKLNQNDLVELKSVLSDINNLLTFQTTIAATNWIAKYFQIQSHIKDQILETIDKTKPNTKGFDIQIDIDNYKIIAEVKCISPVNNGGKFGAAQWNSILDDFHNLKYGKKSSPTDTSKYYKFVFLLDLGDRTEQAINQLLKESKGTSELPLRARRHKIKEHIFHLQNNNLNELNLEKVYLKKISI